MMEDVLRHTTAGSSSDDQSRGPTYHILKKFSLKRRQKSTTRPSRSDHKLRGLLKIFRPFRIFKHSHKKEQEEHRLSSDSDDESSDSSKGEYTSLARYKLKSKWERCTSTSLSDDQPRGPLGYILKCLRRKKRKDYNKEEDEQAYNINEEIKEEEHKDALAVAYFTVGDSADSGSNSSHRSASSSSQSFIGDILDIEGGEVFVPDVLQGEDKQENTYRFVCPRAGQFRCSLTRLVFVTEGEAELLYKTVSWDPRLLDGLGHMQPAGPLYNIDCFNGSISQLHLPHCEILSEDNMDGLAVAHFTDGNVEKIHPVNVSKTHVMIDIKDLSSFGLVWIKKMLGRRIRGQVLLFLRTPSEQKKKILNIHLLPGNVSLSEVRQWHQDKTYIETSSKCCLFLDRNYSLYCHPEECEVQPKSEVFDQNDFEDKNYHPTFEVFLNVSIEEVRLGILDQTEDGKEVWKKRRILLTASSRCEESPAHRTKTECEFVKAHRDKLIERVSSVRAVADSLLTKDMITPEKNNEVQTAEPRQEKTRLLLDALESGGARVKAQFYRLLKEKEPYLVEELEAGDTGAQ